METKWVDFEWIMIWDGDIVRAEWRSSTDKKKYFSTHRIVKLWNSLSQDGHHFGWLSKGIGHFMEDKAINGY